MKNFLPALKMLLFMSVLTGVVYPLFVTAVAQLTMPGKADGQILSRGGVVLGSKLLSQKFQGQTYFWGRPSAVDHKPWPSGGSNLGQASQDLKKLVDERAAALKAAHPDMKTEPPQDLLFASASGLDPHMSVDAANYQLLRVAKARAMDPAQLQKKIEALIEHPQWGVFGETVVNVLALNLALDEAQGVQSAPVLIPAQ